MATDRLQGLNIGTAVKPPCYVASTANLTLSSTQVVDGIAVGSCERVLAKDQTDAKTNGIYVADSAVWTRAKDFDGSRDAIPGTIVYVDRGSVGGNLMYVFNSSSTAVNIDIGSTGDDVTVSLLSLALVGVSAFSQDTLFPLTTSLAWRSSDGLSARGSTITIDSTDITDDAVTLAKLAGSTAGDLITYSTTDAPIVLSKGSTLALLESDGTKLRWAQRGLVVQQVNTQTGAVATGTTVMPGDDTPPQNTEGDEYMTLVITPKNTANRLVIEVVINLANSGDQNMVAALFQDAIAGALAGIRQTMSAINIVGFLSFRHEMAAGTTSATTFKVRGGSTGAGTTTFNGESGARRLGGVMASSITITEIAA